jgi:hypothetical protein
MLGVVIKYSCCVCEIIYGEFGREDIMFLGLGEKGHVYRIFGKEEKIYDGARR